MWVQQKDYKAFGSILRRMRADAGVPQHELAKRLQKPQSFISSYENGQRRVDVLELVRICSALDQDPVAVLREITASHSSPKAKLTKR